jgi:hypothetical protein
VDWRGIACSFVDDRELVSLDSPHMQICHSTRLHVDMYSLVNPFFNVDHARGTCCSECQALFSWFCLHACMQSDVLQGKTISHHHLLGLTFSMMSLQNAVRRYIDPLASHGRNGLVSGARPLARPPPRCSRLLFRARLIGIVVIHVYRMQEKATIA